MRSSDTCVTDRSFNEFHVFFYSYTMTLPHPVIIFSGASSHMGETYCEFNEFDAFFKLLHKEVAAISNFVCFLWARSTHTSGTNGGFNEFHAFLHPVVFCFVFIYAKCSYLKL